MKKITLLIIALFGLGSFFDSCSRIDDSIIPSIENNDILDIDLEEDWYSFRNMDKQTFNNKLSLYSRNGYILIDQEVYENQGKIQFAQVWLKNTANKLWKSHINLTSSEYNSQFNENLGNQYFLKDIEISYINGVPNISSIWEKNIENIGWDSKFNLTKDSYLKFAKEQIELGRRIIDFEAYNTPNGLRFAAIWIDNLENVQWGHEIDLTHTQYTDLLTSKESEDYRLIDLEFYKENGVEFYGVIMLKNWNSSLKYEHDHNLEHISFANRWRKLKDDGYRLVSIEAYKRGSNIKYSGIWLEHDTLRSRFKNKDKIDNIIQKYLETHNLPGISVVVMKHGDIIYQGGAGFADVAQQKIAHSGTIYGIASISKSVGGTLGVKLEKTGRLHDGQIVNLNLDSNSRYYLPDLPEHHGTPVKNYLAHISCIPHYRRADSTTGIRNLNRHFVNSTKAMEAIQDTPLLASCTNGLTYNYSTAAYTFFDAVMEKVTGKSMASLILSEITVPYNLHTLRPQYSNQSLPTTYHANYERAIPYSDDNSESTYANSSWKISGGGLESNAIHLAKFGWMVLNNDFIDIQTTNNRLFTRVNPASNSRYGMGWDLNNNFAEHGGSNSGVKSHLRLYRSSNRVIVVLTNRRTSSNLTEYHNPETLIDQIYPYTYE